ncbi:MAG: hypothetical protein LBP93_08170, partial [Treponema sp.]|nr:hypothetical protein [Treponema sp.]
MSGSAIKKRDYSVEFWRFIFTLGIAMSHFQMLGIGPGRFWGEALKGGKIDLTGVFTLFGTGRFICFFMLITGYFMMAAFQKQKTLGMVEKIEPHRAAWNYLKGRYKALWP